MSAPARRSRSDSLFGATPVLTALAVLFPPAVALGVDTLGQRQAAPASAEISFPTPVRYVIIRREPAALRTLYARGEALVDPQDPTRTLTILRVEAEAIVVRAGPETRPQVVQATHPLPGLPGLTFAGTVLLDRLHYRYRIVDHIVHPEPVVVALQGSQAVLEVEVRRADSRPAAGPAEAATPPASHPTPPARATLDAELLSKVEIEEVGRDLYEVKATDVQVVLDNAERVLAELTPLVLPTFSLKTGLQYRITSAVGDGVLSGRGFTVTHPRLAERAGIQAGDTILSVNGRPVDGFYSLYTIFHQLRRDPAISMVQMKLKRKGTRFTKTYRIR